MKKILLTCLIFLSCQEHQYTALEKMPPKQQVWWDTIVKHEAGIMAPKNEIDKALKISGYKKAIKDYLSVDTNRLMVNWSAKVIAINPMSDSLALLKLQGAFNEEFATITNKIKALQLLEVDSFVSVSGNLLDTMSINYDSITPHGQFYFILDSIKKLPVTKWYSN